MKRKMKRNEKACQSVSCRNENRKNEKWNDENVKISKTMK